MKSVNLKGKGRALEDGLFAERLEMLYEQGLGDLQAFAERENRSFEEVCQLLGLSERRIASAHEVLRIGSAADGGATLSVSLRQPPQRGIKCLSAG